MKEKELEKLYNKYIKNRFMYRAVSEEYYKDIKKNGLNPKKDPSNENIFRKLFIIISI